jgi:SRSO17 transposase
MTPPVAAPQTPRRSSAIRPTLPLAGDRLARFETFVAGLRPVFQRSDQFLRCRAYLRGLLEPGERKNVEAIAAAAAAVMTVEADLSQALQHFVSHSPWDVYRLLAAVRATAPPDPAAAWVIHDGVFVKKGRHSVGVQRQYARAVGKKLNCQVAVVLGRAGPGGYLPLAARLYLPGQWLKDHAEQAERTIPDDHRRGQTKAEIALELLDVVRAEDPTARPVDAEDGYRTSPSFADGLAARGLTAGDGARLPAALEQFERLKAGLGLDHFEGRTWAGWHHHVGLVFTAAHFLATV